MPILLFQLTGRRKNGVCGLISNGRPISALVIKDHVTYGVLAARAQGTLTSTKGLPRDGVLEHYCAIQYVFRYTMFHGRLNNTRSYKGRSSGLGYIVTCCPNPYLDCQFGVFVYPPPRDSQQRDHNKHCDRRPTNAFSHRPSRQTLEFIERAVIYEYNFIRMIFASFLAIDN